MENQPADMIIEKKKLLRYTGCNVRVEVPAGVTAIGEEAFARTAVREIILPDTVCRIGRQSFAYSKLETIQLPEKLKYIGDGVFAGTCLQRIELPGGVAKIPWQAFAFCTQLEEVVLPAGLEQIGSDAFHGCERLKKINLEDLAARIEDGAFGMCDALADENGFIIIHGTLHKSIAIYRAEKIVLPSAVRRIGSFAFHTMDGISRRKKCCSEIVVPDTVEELGRSAFSCCTVLEEITLPEHLGQIPNGCFYGCEKLKKVHMGEHTHFEPGAFAGSGFEAEARHILAQRKERNVTKGSRYV